MLTLDQVNVFLQSYNLVPFQNAPIIYIVLLIFAVSIALFLIRDLVMLLTGTKELSNKLDEVSENLNELIELNRINNRRLKDIREENERLRETWE